MQSEKLIRGLRINRAQRLRPEIVRELESQLGASGLLHDWLALEESDSVHDIVVKSITADVGVQRVVFGAADRNAVLRVLQQLARAIDRSRWILWQSYSTDIGGLAVDGPAILERALQLCKLAGEDVILTTEDGETGVSVEWNDPYNSGHGFENYEITAWGSLADHLRQIANAQESEPQP